MTKDLQLARRIRGDRFWLINHVYFYLIFAIQ
jgi:hypothetical protein